MLSWTGGGADAAVVGGQPRKSAPGMGRTIILVHGRSWKPPRNSLESIWKEALRFGVERDHPGKLAAFDSVRLAFVYFGDLSGKLLVELGRVRPPSDTSARRAALDALKAVPRHGFTRRAYEKVPGQESLKEGVADSLAPVLSFFHLSEPLIASVAPDMRHYWDEDTEFGTASRGRMTPVLAEAFDRGDSILVIGHSLGSLIAYDTLWKFSRSHDFRSHNRKKIDLFISMGSPLGDETVKRHLKGARADHARRFPASIRSWINVAAEDDYISHDQKIAGDYRDMKRLGLVRSITDKRIYNLSAPGGKSNPHHSSGYLLHPVVADAVAGWLG